MLSWSMVLDLNLNMGGLREEDLVLEDLEVVVGGEDGLAADLVGFLVDVVVCDDVVDALELEVLDPGEGEEVHAGVVEEEDHLLLDLAEAHLLEVVLAEEVAEGDAREVMEFEFTRIRRSPR